SFEEERMSPMRQKNVSGTQRKDRQYNHASGTQRKDRQYNHASGTQRKNAEYNNASGTQRKGVEHATRTTASQENSSDFLSSQYKDFFFQIENKELRLQDKDILVDLLYEWKKKNSPSIGEDDRNILKTKISDMKKNIMNKKDFE